MKEIEITETKTEKKIRYQANDGTIFVDSNECKIYEQSYFGMLKADYMKLEKKRIIEEDFYQFAGSEEYVLEFVKINSDKDVELIMKLCLFTNKWIREDENRIAERKKIVESAKGGTLIIGRGLGYVENDEIKLCDGEGTFTPFGSIKGITERIKSFAL